MMAWEMYCIELENMFKDDMGDVLHRIGEHV